MRAITIHQPYPLLMLRGLRTIDQRTWSDPYRGRIAIHAAAASIDPKTKEYVDYQLAELRRLGVDLPEAELVRGRVVAVAELVDVRPLVDNFEDAAASVCTSLTDGQLREFYGRDTPFTGSRWNDEGGKGYAFVFANVEPIAPVPMRGDRGLWEVTPAQLDDLRKAWIRHRKPPPSPS